MRCVQSSKSFLWIFSIVNMVTLLTLSTNAFAGDNDLVLSRFSTFNPAEYGTCSSACGTVNPNKALFQGLVQDLGQVMGPRIANPAETLGEAGFAVNLMTSLSFIDKTEEHWQLGLKDQAPESTMFTGHLQVRKGLPFSFEVAGNMGYLLKSEMFTLGADIKWALNEGFNYFPDLAIRGTVNTLLGSRDLQLVTTGGDISASKAFGLSGVMQITPYVGYQLLVILGTSRLLNAYPQDPRSPQFDRSNPNGAGSTTFSPEFVFETETSQVNRFFFGARLNVWILNFVLEGVIGDVSQATFSGGLDF